MAAALGGEGLLMKRASAICALGLVGCGESIPSEHKINGACTRDGGPAYIAVHNAQEEEGECIFIERCKDNRILVVRP
jgi:hypothetical protein